MKKTYFNIIALLGISAFFVFTPVSKSTISRPKPLVKAAFVSEPQFPVSKDIPAPDLTATGIFISDLGTGIVLLDKNSNDRLKPASLTKIMTALVALDSYKNDEVLTVKNGQNSNGNTIELKKGDSLTAHDLLYALLVPSGNDAAVTLAENYPGGYEAFVKKMNSKAIEIGLQNTHFVNVSGVESSNHYTSAFDIAMIAKAALARPQLAQIVATKKITILSLKGNSYSLESTNLLLGEEGVLGVKTGWTPEAGECLIILVEKNNHSVLISLLNSKDRFGEAKQLISWVFNNYSWL